MKRPGRRYSRGKYWIEQREAVWERAGGICEVTGDDLFITIHGEDCDGHNCDNFDDGYCYTTRRWACHHLVPERVCRRIVPGSQPHILENLVGIVVPLHSRVTAIEAKLSKADWLGWRLACYRLGFPYERLDAAFKALCESVK